MFVDGSLSIVALDPGGTTGWASYDCEVLRDQDQFVPTFEYYEEKWNSGEIGPDAHHTSLWNLLGLKRAQNYVVVCESFEYRKGLRDNVVLVSLEYIGVAKLFVDMEPQTPTTPMWIHMQTAAEGKGFWYPKIPGTQKRDASKLKAVGKYRPGQTHANDAMAHLLHYMEQDMNRKDLLDSLKD
jgi:hypothetical protein